MMAAPTAILAINCKMTSKTNKKKANLTRQMIILRKNFYPTLLKKERR